ncbi:MAG: hypothetical protein EA370_12440 [Wenzhouxiangella sp.]|nr:MAG: hypothetical protein EA370_12440 [Wenzhouxiangella sp.]
MSIRFSSLIRDYWRYLLELSRRVSSCAPASFFGSIPLVTLSQVSFILAFMLPLKVIILIGTEGIPRYLQFFVTEANRERWIVLLALAAVGFFLAYLATTAMLKRLANHGGQQIRARGNKAALFDAEQDFAHDVFLRTAETWGTILLVVGAFVLGLVLEWRLVVILLLALAVETLVLGRYWNRFQEPEQAEVREQFVQNRMNMLLNLAGINTFLAFGVLVVLFLVDPAMNFIVGLVMFILTRQVLQRMVKGVQDAYFMLQQRERIEALVHPDRHVREKRNPQSVGFEALLMPDRRDRLFEAVAEQGYPEVAGLSWAWNDCGARGQALYVARPRSGDQAELRLKVYKNGKDGGLAREVQFYQSRSVSELGLAAECVGSGSVYGRGFVLLRSGRLETCSGKEHPALVRKVRMQLWRHRPDQDLADRLQRSFAALPDRLDSEWLGRIRLGCNDRDDEQLLDAFLGRFATFRSLVDTVPRVLLNRNLSRTNLLVSGEGQPVLLNWDGIGLDTMGVDLSVADLEKAYRPESILAELSESEGVAAHIDSRALELVVHLAELEKIVGREAYRQSLKALAPIVQILERSE